MDRATIRAGILAYLATPSDDPAFTAAILDPLIQEAVDSLFTDVSLQSPGWLVTTVTLTTGATSRDYVFSTQSSPITDFKSWLEVRITDKTGLLLTEAKFDEMNDAGADFFTITGPDDTPTLITSDDTTPGIDLYFRYAQWPAQMASDTDVPTEIPTRFHGVIALETLFVFGLGGEQRRPQELKDRWMDRRAQLMTHAGKRGVQPSRSRIVSDSVWAY